MYQNRKCCVCGDSIQGRIDKKYCSDKCRYVGNNKSKQEIEQPIQSINKILRKNRNILKTLCPEGKTIVRKEVLTEKGYEFGVFSSLYVTGKKELYYLCYDYAFTPLIQHGSKRALIVKRQDYMSYADPWIYVKNDGGNEERKW